MAKLSLTKFNIKNFNKRLKNSNYLLILSYISLKIYYIASN